MIKRFLVSLVCFTLLFSSFIVEVNANESNEIYQEEMPFLTYQSHVQNIGWQNTVNDGATSGTSKQGLRLEAMKISLENVNGSIQYRSHVQDIGWQDWVENGQTSGTSGKNLRLEAVQIQLTGEVANQYDLYYRVHVENLGWMGWAKNGEGAGTTGYGLRLEAIQIKLVVKGEKAPGSTTNCYQQRYISYQAHVQDIGWQSVIYDGYTAGTTGRKLRLEAIKLSLQNQLYSGSIQYRSHVQDIGWQDWVENGQISGTSGRNLRIEAVQIQLTNEMANQYDVYYRVHVENHGWMGWAKNGAKAGSEGYSYRLEGIQVMLVPKGSAAPGSTMNSFLPSQWEVSYSQIDETTQVLIKPELLKQMVSQNTATSMEIVANMNYNSKTTRQIKKEISLSQVSVEGYKLDLSTYGKFKVNVNFKKNGRVVGSYQINDVSVKASEYNLAPLSATFPVVYFSLSLWDINISKDTGKVVPTIVMLDRPSAYNWDQLPTDVYGMPYLTEQEIKATSNYSAYAQYVKDLYEISPNAKFNLYINDITCSYIHDVIYANKIPEGQYTITMLSDGSATYSIMNETYSGTNPDVKHQELIKKWNDAKKLAYQTGKSSWKWHQNWDCMYAILDCEPGTQWWVARNNLFTSGDNNQFAEKIKNDVKVVNVNSLLQSLQNKGIETVDDFKALYNFNDGYFKDAQLQNKKVMMILGTYVNNEKGFKDYAQLTKLYYGDEYMYYYKGHPNTPTGLWPSKQTELAELEIQDVDSAIAAELILFFNPEIYLAGYGTSTFNSASSEMACGLYNMKKSDALSSSSIVDYSGIDWFASKIDKNAVDSYIRDLCSGDDQYYLVELSDEILSEGKYDFGIYNASINVLKFYKKGADGQYVVVQTKSNESKLNYRAHVSNIGWQDYTKEGLVAGTVGQSKSLEAITIELSNVEDSGSIEYRVHVADIGWQEWQKDGKVAGTVGQSRAIEAVSIRLTGNLQAKYDIYYRVHVQDYGWLGWAKNGTNAGTEGLAKRAEAIQIRLIQKGEKAPGSMIESFIKK